MIEVAYRGAHGRAAVDVAFTCPGSGTTVLFGPSGAGKSTAVNVIAGLHRPAVARIVLSGETLADTEAGLWVAPERRRIGLVAQAPTLFPHMSVAANLRYGFRRAPIRRFAVERVADLLALAPLLHRAPHTLSGGERQRVAIGRAILSQPRLLLMDEPLSALDAALKAEILPFLGRLRDEFRIPIVYVTHAMAELATLADHVVLLADGRVVAQGMPEALSARPDLLLAARDDAGSLLATKVVRHDTARRLTLLRAGRLDLWAPQLPLAVNAACRVRVPAREIILARTVPEAVSVHNILHGRVIGISLDGARHLALVQLEAGGNSLLARVTPDAVERLELQPGGSVLALIKSVSIETLTIN